MTSGLIEAASFPIALAGSITATPMAIKIARGTEFLDYPRQYRKHAKPTPFLGGGAVLAAFLLAALAVGQLSGRLLVPVGCAAGLWLLGTIDDRIAVAPRWRILAEVGAGAALFAAGFGWSTRLPGVGDLALTILSIVIAVNAFNLMDNLDGACGTVSAVAAAGIGALAAIRGETAVAGLAFALSGACAGFLPWNLAGPARIFLGDGGSMPVGFLIGALAMATCRHNPEGNAGILAGALLAGLPIFDTALVSYSRIRRGVRLVTGGRDHLTHRLLLRLRGPRAVAASIAVLQAMLSGGAILGYELGSSVAVALALGAFLLAVATLVFLDTPRWRPAEIAVAREHPHPHAAPGAESIGID